MAVNALWLLFHVTCANNDLVTVRVAFLDPVFSEKNVQVSEEDCGGDSGQEPLRGGDVRQGYFQHVGHPGTV